ncbi:coiled-coil domain-containing protein 190 [Callorhinchus milii]|uniref:coiled-coil domain-containing protein 190 n=1 Tax=Callorhinchus milii TaxID=7868 RepID=UPI00045721FE|nr:coiled-coil domain-containing protein 190 [Callorhinchus milii]|eukprot:gi/632956186/ref/XP_007893833.1/ PREDICTED: coiled-coil domain-containing protein C1orf110 homolog [Callorhinchus milii]
MQRLRLRNAEADITRRLEAEHREAKRAEARLMNQLNDLDEAQAYYVNAMSKEQRRVQRDLMRVVHGYSKKTACSFGSSFFANVTPNKENFCSNKIILPTIPAVKDQTLNKESEAIRTQRYRSAKVDSVKTPADPSVALQTRINEFLNRISSKKDKSSGQVEEEEGRASTPSGPHRPKPEASISDINMLEVKHSIAKRLSSSVRAVAAEAPKQREGQAGSQTSQVESEGRGNWNVGTSDLAGKQINSVCPAISPQLSVLPENQTLDMELYTPDGLPRTMYTMPTFSEAFAEAKKARYIRHRVMPDSERELTIAEIFGQRRESVQDNSPKEPATLQQSQ